MITAETGPGEIVCFTVGGEPVMRFTSDGKVIVKEDFYYAAIHFLEYVYGQKGSRWVVEVDDGG